MKTLICAKNKAVCVCDGIITDVIPAEKGYGKLASRGFDKIYEYPDAIVTYGFADAHVHFREPGFSQKETIKTGSLAAAHGGYTAVCTMPNLIPAPDCPENLKVQLDLIKSDALIKVYPYGTITRGQRGEGELSDFEALSNDVIGFSDDGKGVQSKELMRAAMLRAARLDKVIAAHCEDERYLHAGCINAGHYAKEHGYNGIEKRSEWQQIARDVKLAQETGCRYHVCHVSCEASVNIIRRAKEKGAKVTCETAPHYLMLTEDDLCEDARFKMNPPLRQKNDRAALLKGVADGTIDIIATDHAPHTAKEKSRGLETAPFGITGLETAFAVLYTGLVLNGKITLERLFELLCSSPRKIFSLGGALEKGQCADLTVINLNDEYTIDSREFYSMGRSTPFDSMKVKGRICATFVNGKPVTF